MRTTTVAVILAASLTHPALAAEPAEDGAPANKHDGFRLDLRAAAYAGAFDGLGVRRDSGGLAVAEAAATPELRSGALRVQTPVRLEHRQTFGASLSETVASAAVEPDVRVAPKARVGAEAGYAWVNRPDWPDLYQPVGGGLAPTDRYGYGAWRAGVNLYAQPIPHEHLRLRYRYVSTTYVQDPSFKPTNPMHLTPRDNGQHQIDASWRHHGEAYNVAFRMGYTHRQDFTYLARDAGTGSTNSFGNPKQELDDVEPSVEVETPRLGGLVDLSLLYGYQVRSDAFEGYYSYSGHHPRLIATLHLSDSVRADLRAEAWLRTYGPNSKSNTQDGARLRDDREAVRIGVSYALGGGLELRGEGEWIRRDTNFPDYVPNPPGQPYDIRWDYTNLSAIAGIRYRL